MINVNLEELKEQEKKYRELAVRSKEMQSFFEKAAEEVKKAINLIERELGGLNNKLTTLEAEAKCKLNFVSETNDTR
jgi:hypothetical protein